jgi:hypothetical protein
MLPYGVNNVRQEVPLRVWAGRRPQGRCAERSQPMAALNSSSRAGAIALHRREDHSLALLTDVPLDSAWQAPPVENLPRVIQGAAVMELLGMAHRDIPPWSQVLHNLGSMGCSVYVQFRKIIRTQPGNSSVAERGKAVRRLESRP